jgi:adenine specific DNA methylase Mod
LIDGKIEVDNIILKAKDAMGIIDFDLFEIKNQPKIKNTFGRSTNKIKTNYYGNPSHY